MSNKKKITYKDSGVDIAAGEKLVNSIKGMVKETHTDAVLSNIGGFGGFFLPDLSTYEEPVLVSSTDGVGTKLFVAFKMEKYDTIGQDLVNHCVNDIAVCGARPLFFLDYFSTGKLEQHVGHDVVKGFARACKQNGVALVGGETAEMPDIYREGEFDLAGTIVGVVDKKKIITGERIERGDVLLGFTSTGLHTNGYSLARKVLLPEYDIDQKIKELGTSLGKELLKIHKSYLPLIDVLKEEEGVHGFSHITGGGIAGNTKRILPEGMKIEIGWDAWERPAIFDLIKKKGNVPEKDMRATFNLGIGLVAVVAEEAIDEIKKRIRKFSVHSFEIGRVV